MAQVHQLTGRATAVTLDPGCVGALEGTTVKLKAEAAELLNSMRR